MYAIYADVGATGTWANLYYQGDADYAAYDIECVTSKGDAGTLSLTLPKTNPLWGKLVTRKSLLRFQVDQEVIGYFEVREIDHDMQFAEGVYAVGELAWLADSIQPQAEYHDIAPRTFLKTLIDVHNAQCPEHRFAVGTVTVTDPNDSLYRYTNRETTLEAIRDKLVDRLGGQLRLRRSGDVRYVDYLSDVTYGSENTQRIYFGANMLDYSDTLSADGVCSEVIPLGARLENDAADNSTIGNLEKRVTIETVNSGRDYVSNADLVARFGHVRTVATWDDVTEPANLLAKARSWLVDEQYERMHLTLRAVDLSLTSTQFQSIRMGDFVTVVAPAYGLNKLLPVTKRTYHPDAPDSDVMELGSAQGASYVATQGARTHAIEAEAISTYGIQTSRLTEAVENITAMMTGSRGGYKYTEYDEHGRWLADYYMDTPDVDTACVVHKVSLDGDGYSQTGINGPYKTAMMANGTILGEFILAGSVTAEQIDSEYTGQLTTAIKNGNSSVLAYVSDNYSTKSELRLLKDNIRLQVTDAKLGKKATILLTVDDNEMTQEIDLSEARKAFANDNSNVTVSAGYINFAGKSLAINTDNCQMSRDGTLTVRKGSMQGVDVRSGTNGSVINISDGEIALNYGGGSDTVYIHTELEGIADQDGRYPMFLSIRYGTRGPQLTVSKDAASISYGSHQLLVNSDGVWAGNNRLD